MNFLLSAAAFIGLIGVGLGAFGAHGLEGRLTEQGEGWWQTATLYALVHAAAALAVSLSGRGGSLFVWSGWAFVIGAVIFSGSLYAMALGGPRWLGAVTPIGGVSFLAGWGLMLVAGLRLGGQV
jgi:uncharacterized membrane protein YgdD (TMEM256/DUF423 family)